MSESEKEPADGASAPPEDEAQLPQCASTFQDALFGAYGEGRDPKVDLHADGSDSVEGSASARIESLRSSRGSKQRYTLKGEIGRGGMGAILKIFDTDLRRHLAMKVVLGQHGKGSSGASDAERQMLVRFLEEAQVTGQLDHPGVVPVHELGADEAGQVYFTMRLVKGQDLSKVFAKVGKGDPDWSRTRVLSVLLKVCEAMSYAHEKGVIHRDLKPANVMVGRHGAVYVMDWGLARVEGREDSHDLRLQQQSVSLSEIQTDKKDAKRQGADSPLITMDGAVMGTPFYMPPEQAAGRLGEIGPHSDVYSLGAMLYHLLTGRMPYYTPGDHASPHTVLAMVMAGPPKPIDDLAPDIAPELVSICEKAMKHDQADRYSNMGELAEDLRAYLENRVVKAHRTGAMIELKKWVQRNKALTTVTALGVLALCGGLIGTTLQYREADRNRLLAEQNESTAVARAREAREAADDAREAEVRSVEARNEAQRQSYLANIIAADTALSQGMVSKAKRRLAAAPEHLRNWEWSHLAVRAEGSLMALVGHEDIVHSVAFSPDGRLIASASEDHTIKVWAGTTGEAWGTLRGHEGPVYAVAFDSDGSRLASASGDNTVRLWDSAEGQELAVLRGHESSVFSVAVSADGTRIVSGSSDKTIRLWDAETGEAVTTIHGHERGVLSVAFSPDGTRIVSGSHDRTIRLWDAETGEAVTTLRGHERSVLSVAFSPDGTRIVSGSNDKTIRIWNSETGKEVSVLQGHESAVNSVAFSPDSTRIVSASADQTIRLWDAFKGKEIATLRGHQSFALGAGSKGVNSVTFSPDGSRIASASHDHTIRLWDSFVALREHQDGVLSVAFSPDGTRIATSDKGVRLWNSTTGEKIATITGKGGAWPVSSVAFSPDGSQIATGLALGGIILWDSTTGEKLTTLEGHELGVHSVAFDPTGTRIASTSSDRTVRLWDSATRREILTLRGHERSVTCAAFSPDGARVASGSDLGVVKLWDSNTGSEIRSLRGHESFVNAVAFLPDGTIVSGARDGLVKLWNSDTGEEIATLRGHQGAVTTLAVSPDGTRIASGSFDMTIKLWSPTTAEELLTLHGHDHIVYSVAFSPDGTQLASGSYDNTLRIWDSVPSRRRLTERQDLLQARKTVYPRIDGWFEEGLAPGTLLSRLLADEALTDPMRRAARDHVLELSVNQRAKGVPKND